MIYTINRSNLYDLIDEEVSRVAAREHDEQDGSLYDGIVLHSGDRPEIMRFIGDNVNTIVRQTYMVVTILANDPVSGQPRLEFSVPDIDTSTEQSVEEELTRFIVLEACSKWFTRTSKNNVEEFTTRAASALEKAKTLLLTRKSPTRHAD